MKLIDSVFSCYSLMVGGAERVSFKKIKLICTSEFAYSGVRSDTE